jgi:hypothetical protein
MVDRIAEVLKIKINPAFIRGINAVEYIVSIEYIKLSISVNYKFLVSNRLIWSINLSSGRYLLVLFP